MTSKLKDRLSKYLEHLDGIFRMEPEFHLLRAELPETPDVVGMVYRDVPDPGYITGVTYGLSEVQHPEWRLGRPELTITVKSLDVAWPLAVAEIANRLRGRCPFCYGDVIDFGDRIAEESEMSAFFVFVPAILERSSFLAVDVGGPQPINIAGAYPIYDSERAVFSAIGLEKFWHHPHFDMYDVHRRRVEREPISR